MSVHRTWAAALGVVVSSVAVAGITLLVATPAQSEQPVPAVQSAPAPVSAPEPEPVPPPTPDQLGIEESATPQSNQNPIDLISGTLAAIERDDRAWLARVMHSRAGKVLLTEVDGLDAHRNFLWRSIAPYWGKVRAAWVARTYTVDQQDGTALIRLEVGGNLGQIEIRLIRVADAWYFEGM